MDEQVIVKLLENMMEYWLQMIDTYKGIYERVVGTGAFAVLLLLAIIYLSIRLK